MCLFWQLKNLNQFFYFLEAFVWVRWKEDVQIHLLNVNVNGHAFMTACPSYEALYVLSWMLCVCLYDVIRLLEHFVVCVWPCALLRSVCLGFLLLCAEAKVCACLFVRLCSCVSEFTCCGMQGDWQVLSCSYLGISRKTKTSLLSEVMYVTYTHNEMEQTL